MMYVKEGFDLAEVWLMKGREPTTRGMLSVLALETRILQDLCVLCDESGDTKFPFSSFAHMMTWLTPVVLYYRAIVLAQSILYGLIV